MVGSGPHQAEPVGSNDRTTFLTLNGKKTRTNIERVVYEPPIQAKAVLRRGVTCPKGKTTIKPYSGKLMT